MAAVRVVGSSGKNGANMLQANQLPPVGRLWFRRLMLSLSARLRWEVSPPSSPAEALTNIGPKGRCQVSGLSDLRVKRIESRDRHPAPFRVLVLSNEVPVFEPTRSPTFQRQDGRVQLLGPVNVTLLVDLLLQSRVEVDRCGGHPGDGESAPANQCGRGCHRSLNDDPGCGL